MIRLTSARHLTRDRPIFVYINIYDNSSMMIHNPRILVYSICIYTKTIPTKMTRGVLKIKSVDVYLLLCDLHAEI